MSIKRGIKVFVAGVAITACAVGAWGCNPKSADPTAGAPMAEQIADQVREIEQYARSIQWIMPLAQGVISMFFPQYMPEVGMALASYNGLLTAAHTISAAAAGDTSAVDPGKVAAVLTQLKDAWTLLDGGYKADPAAVQKLLGVAS